MKKIIMLIIAVTLLFPVVMSAKKESKAKINFVEKSYNFGNLKENAGPVSHEFIFVNDGNDNLNVHDATAQCGCTKPEYPKNPIAPGKSGKIKVTFNPIGQPLGAFEKVVTVRTNAKGGKVRLKIFGNIVPKK